MPGNREGQVGYQQAVPRVSRADRAESLRRVEQEIRQAKAETLGRVGERLDRVLGDLAEHDRRLDQLAVGDGVPGPRLAAAIEARNRIRDEARRLVQQLIIQREAIGLTRHTLVLERYPVPPRRCLQ